MYLDSVNGPASACQPADEDKFGQVREDIYEHM